MNTKQYTVMVETKEIRKFCVVANSAEEAAEFICKVVADTDILHTDLSEDSEVITQVAAYGKDEKDTAKYQMFRVGVPCDEDEPTLGGIITPEELFTMIAESEKNNGDDENDRRESNKTVPENTETDNG